MATKDGHPVIREVLASYGWFTQKTYDLVLTKDTIILVVVAPRTNGPAGLLKRMRAPPIDRVNDLGASMEQEGTIVIPCSTVRSVRFYAPPVQPNQEYDRLGLYVTHGPDGKRPRKLTIVIDARPYIMQRISAETMPRGMSKQTLRWNEILSEYAETVTAMLRSTLPPEIIEKTEWRVPADKGKRSS